MDPEGKSAAGGRVNQGIPPDNYGYGRGYGNWAPPLLQRRPSTPHSTTSVSSVSSQKRRRMEIDLEAERKRIESTLKLVEMERQLAHARLEEEEEQALGSESESPEGTVLHGTGLEEWDDNPPPLMTDDGDSAEQGQHIPLSSGGSHSRVAPGNLNRTSILPQPLTGANAVLPLHTQPSFVSQGQGHSALPTAHPPHQISSSLGPQSHNQNQGQSTPLLPHTRRFQPSSSPNHFTPMHQSHRLSPSEEFMKEMVNSLRKLRPPSELPSFSGDSDDWPRFISEFKHSTERGQLTNVENSRRLQKSLKGKALESVKSLFVHPDNLPRIIETLELRFGRPELIIEEMIEKAKRIKKIRDDQLELTVDLACHVDNLATTIEALHRPMYLYNPQLIRELQDKLPSSVKLNWDHYAVSRGSATIRDMADWLKVESKGLVQFMKPSSSSSSHEHEKDDKKPRRIGNLVAVTEEVTDPPRSEKTKKCPFCSLTNHSLYQCPTYKKKTTDQRREAVKKHQLCFNCLGKGHLSSKCPSQGCRKCDRKHHTSLHIETPPSTKLRDQPEDTHNVVAQIGENMSPSQRVLAQIVPVTVFGPKGTLDTFVFFDLGSKCSLMEEEAAESLGFSLPKKKTSLTWIDGTPREEEVSVISIRVKGKSEDLTYTLSGVKTFPGLSLPLQTVTTEELEKWGLGNLNIPTYHKARPTILIGLDHAHLFSPSNATSVDRPYLSETKLGFTLFGPVATNNPTRGNRSSSSPHYIYAIREEVDLHQLVSSFFSTEEFGVRIGPPRQAKEITQAMGILNTTTRRIDGGWETGLLWKDEGAQLPESYSVALKRLHSVERKMDKDPGFSKRYDEKIQENLMKGFARPITGEEKSFEGRKWYLPHFHHHNPKKPKKVRLVYDAKAKSHGQSLNDFLLAGPDLYKPLAEVLVKFRQHKYGFSGDIRDMFPRIKIRFPDFHCQRFLYRGMDRSQPPSEYVMESMTFGATCSPASAHYVKNRNAEEFLSLYPGSAAAIINNHYVDDYLDSQPEIHEAKKRVKEVSEIHQQGGFTICSWVSSHSDILADIPKELQAEKEGLGFGVSAATERVLGLYWNPSADVFTFQKSYVLVDDDITRGKKIPTKREMLRLLMSPFDPMGFIAHFIVKGKILLQETWRTGIGWDDQLPFQLFDKWKLWTEELQSLVTVAIPRCYEPRVTTAEGIQLHIFGDDSELAFTAVAYLRFQLQSEVTTAFVMAKTRVAPLRPMTIPRLELQAAVMGCRLAETIKGSHTIPITETHFWTDSTTVYGWIHSEARSFTTFVANRVGEVQESTGGGKWHWLPTDENVADEATRDNKPCDFSPSSRWFNGPQFLLLSEEYWPHLPIKDSKMSDDEEAIQTVATVDDSPSFINFKVFGSYVKLVRTVAWMLRLSHSKKDRQKGSLTTKEFSLAEGRLWILVQMESFPSELKRLRGGSQVEKSSKLNQLSPFLHPQGLIRLKGRTEKSPDLGPETRAPIIIDNKHHVTRLLIQWYHQKFHHQGQETVLNELRQKFWILTARSAVRKAFRDCRRCQLEHPVPLIQEMGALPSARVTRQIRPFTEVGLDYFGPMEVTVGRRREKRYGALFTCMTTRAVHVEVAASLTTDSTIMAIRRMVSRRGTPREIFSDNGTNFHGAANEIKASLKDIDQTKMKEKMAEMNISWRFNPPSAPHMGGVWERLVQSIKVSLKSTLRERAPKDEVLHTLLLESENVVNSRPITFVSNDPNDPEALTPNHFLIGSSSGVTVPGEFTKRDLCLRNQWRESQALADKFWTRWVKEYLPTLNKRSKWTRPGPQLNIGDLVFIADGGLIRGTWPKGLVTATFPGKDGQVRVVEVKTASGTYRRPICKIMAPHPPEISSKIGGSMSSGENQDSN